MRRFLAYASPYVVLAAVIAATHGTAGLTLLLSFYVLVGGWIAFIEVWGWAARAAARLHVDRLNEPTRDDDPTPTGTPEPVEDAVAAEQVPATRVYRRQPKPALTL